MIYPSSGPFVALRPKSKLQRAHGRSCEGGTTRLIREDIRVNRQSQHHSALQFACARWCKLSIAPILPSRLSKLRRKEPPNSLPERHQGTSPPPQSAKPPRRPHKGSLVALNRLGYHIKPRHLSPKLHYLERERAAKYTLLVPVYT